MQNAAFREAAIDARYEAWDVPPEEAAALRGRLRAEGVAGGNVTVPHKAAFFRLSDAPDPIARRLGAVNAFRLEPDGAIAATNTDVAGFAEAARVCLGRDFAGICAAVLGAGGSARAVVAALAEGGAEEIRVLHHRDVAKAAALEPLASPARFVAFGPRDRTAAFRGACLVVNTTPLGMRVEDPLPVRPEETDEGAALYDLVYRPAGETTPAVSAFRSAGRRADDGTSMLLTQGARAFEFWTGRPAPREAMARALAGV